MDDLTTWRIECSLTAGMRLVVISSMAVRNGSGDTGGKSAWILADEDEDEVGDGSDCCDCCDCCDC